MNLVYLVVNDMQGVLDDTTIEMVNHRNADIPNYEPLTSGATYEQLKAKYEQHNPYKGAGYERTKGGQPFWILPFKPAEGMPAPDPNAATVIDREGVLNFGFDVEDEESH